MCSINGFFKLKGSTESIKNIENKITDIILKAEDRGRDSAGYVIFSEKNSIIIAKSIEKFSDEDDFKVRLTQDSFCLLSNNRAEPTTEFVNKKTANDVQPFSKGSIHIVHNGTIANDKELEKKYLLNRRTKIDSAIIPELLYKIWDGTAEDLQNILINEMIGSYGIAIFDENDNTLFLATNYKPLFILNDNDVLYFSSLDTYLIDDDYNERILSNKNITEVKPYTLLEINRDTKEIKQFSLYKKDIEKSNEKKKALIIASAGLDSTTAAAWAKNKMGYDVTLLHYRYSARAETKEVEAIKKIAERLDVPLVFIDLDFLKTTVGGSKLTGTKEDNSITKGNDGADGAELAIEWVPARNLVFLSIAAAYAESKNIDYIILGGNLEESGCLLDVKENCVRMFDRTKKMPSDIKIGDELLSWNFSNNKIEKTIVEEVYTPIHKRYYHIKCKGRKFKNRKQEEVFFKVSGEHPFYIKGKEFVEASKLIPGDIIMRYTELKQCELQSNTETNNGAFKKDNLIGEKNPMYGHKRDGTICHCGIIHPNNPEKIRETLKKLYENEDLVNEMKEKMNKLFSSPEGELIKKKISKAMKIMTKKRIKKLFEETGYTHWNQIPEIAEKLSKSISLAIKEGKINPAATKELPTKIEKRFINFFQKNNLPFRYTGDGQIWITSKGKHMNPDFVNLELKKIIEVTTSDFYFHTEEEKRNRKDLYQNIGWDMLYLDDLDLKNENETKLLIEQFMGGLKNGLMIDSIEIIEEEVQTYNYHCSPNNNFFIGSSGALTHNSYADNEYIFQKKFNDLLPNALNLQNKVEVLMPLANLMKSEIVKLGIEVNAPLDLTWSCYEGGNIACGECGPDYMRKTAFKMLGIKDIVEYAKNDEKFWENCISVKEKYPEFTAGK